MTSCCTYKVCLLAVEQADRGIAHVHDLLAEHVGKGLFVLGGAEKVELAGNVALDGLRLGDLHVAVNQIRQVWKVQAERLLLAVPFVARVLHVRPLASCLVVGMKAV